MYSFNSYQTGPLQQFLEKKKRLSEHLQSFAKDVPEMKVYSKRRSLDTIQYLQQLQQQTEERDQRIIPHQNVSRIPIPKPIQTIQFQSIPPKLIRPKTHKYDEVVESISEILAEKRPITFRRNTRDQGTMTSGSLLPQTAPLPKQVQRSKYIQTEIHDEHIVEQSHMTSSKFASIQTDEVITVQDQEVELAASPDEVVHEETHQETEPSSDQVLEDTPDTITETSLVNNEDSLPKELMRKEYAPDSMPTQPRKAKKEEPDHRFKEQLYIPPILKPDTPKKFYFQGKPPNTADQLQKQEASNSLPEFFTRLDLHSPAEEILRPRIAHKHTEDTMHFKGAMIPTEQDTGSTATESASQGEPKVPTPFEIERQNSKQELQKQSSQIQLDLQRLDSAKEKKNRRASFSDTLTTHERAKTAPVVMPKSILKKPPVSKPGTASSTSSTGSGYAKRFSKKKVLHIDPTLFRHFGGDRDGEVKPRPKTTHSERKKPVRSKTPEHYSDQVDLSYYQEQPSVQPYQMPPQNSMYPYQMAPQASYPFGYYEQPYYNQGAYPYYDMPQMDYGYGHHDYHYSEQHPYYDPQSMLMKEKSSSKKSSIQRTRPSKTKPIKSIRLPPLQKPNPPSKVASMNQIKHTKNVGPIHRHAKDVVSGNPKGVFRQLYSNSSPIDSIYNYY